MPKWGALKPQAGAWEWPLLCEYVRTHLTSECDFSLKMIFVQNWKASVSPITFEFEESSYATFTFPEGARQEKKTSEKQLVRPRCSENAAGDMKWEHPDTRGCQAPCQVLRRRSTASRLPPGGSQSSWIITGFHYSHVLMNLLNSLFGSPDISPLRMQVSKANIFSFYFP